MTCVEVTTKTSAVHRGLCEKHALELAESLPIEFDDEALRGPVRFDPPKYADGQEVYRVSDPRYQVAVDAINAQERCSDCPTYVGDELYELTRTPNRGNRLGPACAEEARAAADALYPRRLPQVYPRDLDVDPENSHLNFIYWKAGALLEDLRIAVFNSWPTCENCPIPQAPVLAKVDQRLDGEILEALALYGTLNTSDLVAAVKKLTNAISKKVLEKMVEDGRIVLERRGNAKFYSLPA